MSIQREYHETYESEIGRLNELTGCNPPCLAAGSRSFFANLNSWLFNSEVNSTDKEVIVLPDPAMNLALPYPEDEIELAFLLSDGKHPTKESIVKMADACFVPLELLGRPVTALSGGERMQVAFTKALILSSKQHCTYFCSPYFWLDTEHRMILDNIMQQMNDNDTSVRLLLLVGEDCRSEINIDYSTHPEDLSWRLGIDSVRVDFPGMRFPRQSEPKVIIYKTQDGGDIEFRSPTLISGPNGVGKTTLAKALAGILPITVGSPSVIRLLMSGKARLLLQDPLMHLFGHMPQNHLLRVFRFDEDRHKQANDLFMRLQKSCASKLDSLHCQETVGNLDKPGTILQAKLALVAERLSAPTPLLILDEPGWCLSREYARAFLASVVEIAHENEVAIAFISHQTIWWSGLIADELTMTRNTGDIVMLNRRRVKC